MLLDFKKQATGNIKAFLDEIDPIPTHPNDDNGDLYYGYISKGLLHLEDLLSGIKTPPNAKILDIGAGYCEMLLYIGHVLKSSNMHGIEVNQKYFTDTAPLLVKHRVPVTLYLCDYRKHDISSYDVIYSFSIAKKLPEKEEMYRYVLDNMKPGAIWIEALAPGLIDVIKKHKRSFDIFYSELETIALRAK